MKRQRMDSGERAIGGCGPPIPDGRQRVGTDYPAGPRMLARPLIERKRDGGRISPDEWRSLAGAYAAGEVPDYQMAALLMAVYFQGMDREETSALMEAMLHSGAVLDLSHLTRPRIDKHSTGGVGDKVSLVLAPLIASLG